MGFNELDPAVGLERATSPNISMEPTARTVAGAPRLIANVSRTDSITMMTIDVAGLSDDVLVEYARIPIAFEVRTILEVADNRRHNTFHLSERPAETVYVKDYDAHAHSPTQWPARFDTSQWALMIARTEGGCVGGAAVAYRTPELDVLEGRSDLAVLWDIRVLPQNRRQGVGAALFGAAQAWAVARDCRQLMVETQNINVAACRFYAQRGCVLRAVRPGAYPECPDEVQLLWYKELTAAESAG